jgi:membrane-bound lytic murein transglycosylase D
MGSAGSVTQNDASAKITDRKTSTPASGTAPAYNAGTSHVYNNGDGVMPKGSRDDRLSKSLDLAIPPDDSHESVVSQIERDDLWQRIKNGYAIPESTSNLTQKHEQWYSSRPDYVKRMVERSQRYLFHVVEEVEKRGMPT